jgi:hypothetical protein
MANLPVSGEWTGVEIPSQTIVTLPPVSTKLNIVLPFIELDVPKVINLLKWCAELSGKVPYSIFILPFKGINFTEVKMYAERAFADVQTITDSEGVTSDWRNDDKIRDAAGPNSMFRQAAWYFYFHQRLGPWLYLEPDCVPLKKDWIAILESDHSAGGAAISGVKMEIGDRAYLNGVAIYPANVIQHTPGIVNRTMWQQHPEMEVAFDIGGGEQVLQQAHQTDKIQLCYRAKWYQADLLVDPKAVLFHGDRDGSLIETLRRQGISAAGKMADNRSQPPESVSGSPLNDPGIPQLGASELIPRADNGAAGTPSFSSIAEEIRYHCDQLLNLVRERSSRSQQVLDELRKRKLAPHARKQKHRERV